MDETTDTFDVVAFKASIAELVCLPDTEPVDSSALWNLFGPLLERYPNSAGLHVLIGDCVELGMVVPNGSQDSCDYYRKASEIDPFFSDAYSSLGHYCLVRDENRSHSYFSVAAGLNRNVSTLTDLATAYLDGGRLEDARSVLNEARDVLSEVSRVIEDLSADIEKREG